MSNPVHKDPRAHNFECFHIGLIVFIGVIGRLRNHGEYGTILDIHDDNASRLANFSNIDEAVAACRRRSSVSCSRRSSTCTNPFGTKSLINAPFPVRLNCTFGQSVLEILMAILHTSLTMTVSINVAYYVCNKSCWGKGARTLESALSHWSVVWRFAFDLSGNVFCQGRAIPNAAGGC